MHKLLTILNAMLKHQTPWQPLLAEWLQHSALFIPKYALSDQIGM